MSRGQYRVIHSRALYSTFSSSCSGAEKHAVHGSSERNGQMLDEGFEQHAGGIDGQNDNFLPPFCQAIPFPFWVVQSPILLQRTKIGNLTGIRLRDVGQVRMLIGLPDLSQHA